MRAPGWLSAAALGVLLETQHLKLIVLDFLADRGNETRNINRSAAVAPRADT
jgi:hypothetical protein